MEILKRYTNYTLAFFLIYAWPLPANANELLKLHEEEIRAGLLYNFLKYTEWPQSHLDADGSIIVCIFGNDPFKGYLQPMGGRTVNHRTIVIRQVKGISETDPCHLLYVNAQEKSRWPQLQSHLNGKSVLTVSDFKDFARTGGMIEFGHKDNHINASINLDAIMAGQLRVGERLIRLVTVLQADAKGDGL